MLAVRRMASPHSAERVLEAIEEVLTEWEIPHSKVSAILTDNGSNMVAAFCAHFQNEGEDEEKDESEEIEVMLILVLINVQISKGERWSMNLF